MNMIFDTLEISEKLKSAKFTKAQSDTLIDIYRHQNDHDQIVTKDDIKEMATKADINIAVNSLRIEMYKALFAQTFIIIGVLFTLLRYFPV